MLAHLCHASRQQKLPSVLLTFEPLPQEFFAGEQAAARLMGLREKWQYLAANTQLDALLCIPFNKAFSHLAAEQFVEAVLVRGLGARYVLLGDDFRFGYQRAGDYDLLQRMSAQGGFKVETMPSVKQGGHRVSSTRVRTVLGAGDLAQAAKLLGRPYCLSGRVARGDQLGRTLGYPTANIYLRRSRLPLLGVFAVSVRGLGGAHYQGMANIGWRPTVAGRELRFEVHLLDFESDIYGQYLEVDFLVKLRDEMRFDSLEVLTAQLAADELATRNYFSTTARLSV